MVLNDGRAENREDVIVKYFDLNIFILKVAGVWYDDGIKPFTNRLLRLSYNTFWIIYCLFLYQPIETAVTFQTFELTKIVRSLRDQFNHISCIFKLIGWLKNRKMILEIMRTLQSRKFEYEDFENFKSNDIYRKYRQESNIWTKIFLLGVNSICLNMCFSILFVFIFNYDKQYILDDDGTIIYDQPLAVDLVLPYKISNRIIFISTFAFQVIALDIYGWMIIGEYFFFVFSFFFVVM